MKVADIRKLSTEELTSEQTKLRMEIVDMRRRLYSGEMTNVRAIRAKRKDLARVLTVLEEQLSREVVA
jgi:large subunit ribosomal protein L29